MLDQIKHYAKFIAALLGAIAASFAGLIPETWGPWLQALIAFATAISVFAIPNTPLPKEPFQDGEGLFE